MTIRSRKLVIAWAVILLGSVSVFGPWVAMVSMLAALVTSVFTYRMVRRDGLRPLAFPIVYRTPLAILALACAVAAVSAAGAFISDPITGKQSSVSIATAIVSILVAMLAWRAYVRPSPRIAAAAGLATYYCCTAAAVADMVMGHRGMHAWAATTVLAQDVAFSAVPLVFIAVLTTFDRPNDGLPTARTV